MGKLKTQLRSTCVAFNTVLECYAYDGFTKHASRQAICSLLYLYIVIEFIYV